MTDENLGHLNDFEFIDLACERLWEGLQLINFLVYEDERENRDTSRVLEYVRKITRQQESLSILACPRLDRIVQKVGHTKPGEWTIRFREDLNLNIAKSKREYAVAIHSRYTKLNEIRNIMKADARTKTVDDPAALKKAKRTGKRGRPSGDPEVRKNMKLAQEWKSSGLTKKLFLAGRGRPEKDIRLISNGIRALRRISAKSTTETLQAR